MHFARQHSYPHPSQIIDGSDRPQAIRNMAKTIFEVTEHAIAHVRLDLCCQCFTQGAIHGCVGGGRIRKQEWKIGYADVGHAVLKITARLVSERQQTLFDQPNDVVGEITEIHDVVDVAHLHGRAKSVSNAIADAFEGEAEARG